MSKNIICLNATHLDLLHTIKNTEVKYVNGGKRSLFYIDNELQSKLTRTMNHLVKNKVIAIPEKSFLKVRVTSFGDNVLYHFSPKVTQASVNVMLSVANKVRDNKGKFVKSK
jgi:hypothetical protein